MEDVFQRVITNDNRISTFQIDITNTEELKKCISEIIENNEEIDVLINNAGILFKGLLDTPIEKFEIMLNTHLYASYNFIKLIAPIMKKKMHGYIFNISSRSGKNARPEFGTYAISKYALMGLNEALYEEMMPYNIKVTAICPSVTDTHLISDDHKFAKEQKIQAKDIVDTIWYLLSLGNNAYIKEISIDCKAAFLDKTKGAHMSNLQDRKIENWTKILTTYFESHIKQRFLLINYFIIIFSSLFIAAYFAHGICRTATIYNSILVILFLIMTTVSFIFYMFEKRVKFLIKRCNDKLSAIEDNLSLDSNLKLFGTEQDDTREEENNIKLRFKWFGLLGSLFHYSKCINLLILISWIAYAVFLVILYIQPISSNKNCNAKNSFNHTT